MPLYLLPCRWCHVRLSFLQGLWVSTDASHDSYHRTMDFCWIGPVGTQRTLYAGIAIPHLSPVLYHKCVNTAEMGRELPYSSLTLISFQGNAKHDKGWQSKTIKYSYRHQKQDSPTVDYRTNLDQGGLLLKQLFLCRLFRFSKQLLAKNVNVSLLQVGFFGHYSAQFFYNAPWVSLRARLHNT